MLKDHSATLVDRTNLTSDLFYLTFKCPELANSAEPGQFVQLRLDPAQFTLRRAFAVACTDKQAGTFSLFIRQVGEGTAYLAALKNGAVLSALGSLGRGWRGWQISEDAEAAHICVSGGVGLAPVYDLARALTAGGEDRLTALIVGMRTKAEIDALQDLLAPFESNKVYLVSDDGAYGGGLNPAQMLQSPQIAQLITNPSKTNVYICGPSAMTKACVQAANNLGAQSQASLEERMACGFGVCLGCAVDTKKGKRRVCKAGPVFKSEDLLWD